MFVDYGMVHNLVRRWILHEGFIFNGEHSHRDLTDLDEAILKVFDRYVPGKHLADGVRNWNIRKPDVGWLHGPHGKALFKMKLAQLGYADDRK